MACSRNCFASSARRSSRDEVCLKRRRCILLAPSPACYSEGESRKWFSSPPSLRLVGARINKYVFVIQPNFSGMPTTPKLLPIEPFTQKRPASDCLAGAGVAKGSQVRRPRRGALRRSRPRLAPIQGHVFLSGQSGKTVRAMVS
jgi:hypothetical protein